MTAQLAFSQLLNGLQLGVLLFLLAAGLTLVFGIMSFVNLAHGSLYMLGAYFGAAMFARTESFLLGLIAAVVGAGLVGLLLDRFALTKLYERDHLDQVLATFGLILFFNELIRIIWGPSSVFMQVPDASRLRHHLKGFLRVRSEAGQKMIFRYYDPRVLRAYLPTCNAAELKTVFGSIRRFVVEAEDPAEVLEFGFDGSRLQVRRVPLSG